MVRTRADGAGTRAAGAKAPRKNGPVPVVNSGGGEKSKGREQSGGNSYCPRETPDWQKPITSFFIRPQEAGESSKSDKRRERNMDLDSGASTSAASTSKEETDDS